MSRKIRRTFNKTLCNGHRYIFETNELHDFYDELEGKNTPEQAMKKLRKKWNDDSIVITNVEIVNEIYTISKEDFIKYAERIN